ncbi:MAG: hypothetical protein MK135_14150, partial [Polyangiaceae bacterium]|nr:hypothetical protein [Polyangiaceae bacterium]
SVFDCFGIALTYSPDIRFRDLGVAWKIIRKCGERGFAMQQSTHTISEEWGDEPSEFSRRVFAHD